MHYKILANAMIAGLLLAGQAHAAAPRDPATAGGVSLQYGMDGDLQRLTLNYETPALWSYRFANSRVDLVGEFGVSYWRNHDAPGGSYDSLWQLSAIPMFQWWLTPRFFVEAGIGATAFNHTHIGTRHIGSAFQFGDHIGAGFQLTENARLGVRFSHFSNARIKHPNDGLNSYQATLAVRW